MKKIVPALLAVAFLAACNTSGDLERGLIGAGLGCAAGEIIRDGNCVAGAVVGGTAGVIANDI